MQFCCFKCGKLIDVTAAAPIGTRDGCPKCDADLHCCRNCRFYDPAQHNQCAETQAEWVRVKEAANLCGYFQPNPVLLASGERAPSTGGNASKNSDSLFRT